MYQILLFFHSILRWLVVVSMIYAVYRAYKGYVSQAVFTKTDNFIRHWTATIAHIQLVIGIVLYTQSPVISYFLKYYAEAFHIMDVAFFGLIHSVLMLSGIGCITIGSALSKRKQTDKERFKTMLVWFLISLVIIFIAIPWPFSPLASRPYLR